MNKFFVVMVVFLAQISNVFGQGPGPEVSSPTQEQVFYVGETIPLRWKSKRPSAWPTVNISLKRPDGQFLSWVKVGSENNGSFDWTAEQPRGMTRFIIEIADGGQDAQWTQVVVNVHSGTRPDPETPVVTGKVVTLTTTSISQSLYWESVSGTTYRIEKNEGGTWTKVLEEMVEINGGVVWPLPDSESYRVINVTQQNSPVTAKRQNSLDIAWQGHKGHTYRVQSTTDLRTWSTIAEGTVENDSCLFKGGSLEPNAFFRVIDITQ